MQLFVTVSLSSTHLMTVMIMVVTIGVIAILIIVFCYSAIRQALTSSGKFEAALLVCNKYQLDKAGVYASWGLSELAIGGQEHFKLAREKFKHYYQVNL